MKVKGLIYCLLAFCMLALSSCGPENDDYVDKVVGEYNIKITPSIAVKYGNSTLPIAIEAIETTAVVTEKDDAGNVSIFNTNIWSYLNIIFTNDLIYIIIIFWSA